MFQQLTNLNEKGSSNLLDKQIFFRELWWKVLARGDYHNV